MNTLSYTLGYHHNKSLRPSSPQLLTHPKTNVLVIRGYDAFERDKFKVRDNLFDNPDAAYGLTSKLFMTAILKQTGWDERYSYRICGQYSDELSAVVFDMNQVEGIEKDDKRKRTTQPPCVVTTSKIYMDL